MRVLGLAAVLVASEPSVAPAAVDAPYDDFHYPTEEAEERAAAEAMLPTVSCDPCELGHPAAGPLASAKFSCPNAGGGEVPVGGNITCGSVTWQVHAIWGAVSGTAVPVAMAAVETQFRRWGVLAFLAAAKKPVVLRKSVGRLTGIEQPWFNLTAPYLAAAALSLADLPSQRATNMTADHEPDYPSMASTLAPQRDTAAISHAADVVKFAVAYSGRVKCGSTGVLKEVCLPSLPTCCSPPFEPFRPTVIRRPLSPLPCDVQDSNTGGIAELRDLRAPFPDSQKLIFDPPNYLKYWPSTYGNSKIGLVGGHLGVANVGAMTVGVGGMELMAFGPVPPHEKGGVPPPFPYVPPPPPPAEAWECAKPGKFGTGSSQASCLKNNHTWTAGNNAKYPGCGTCYCCQPYSGPAAPLPRLPNINYNPGAFVMLRDEGASGSSVNGTRYFYATNDTTKELPLHSGAASFYQSLLAVYEKDAALLSGMQVQLPDSDRRQVDMAHAALLATTNNFVGNQPNYGFGATYWSYGREDNGSLPLDLIPIDNALMAWGVCDTAIDHIGFWLDNYIAADGHVVYFSGDWVKHGDSIADLGRIVDLFLNAVKLCSAPAAWQRRHLPTVSSIGARLLNLRSLAPKLQNGTAPTPHRTCVFGAEQTMTYLKGDVRSGEKACSAKTLDAAKAKCAAAADCGGITQQSGMYQCRQSHVPAPATEAQPANSWPITNVVACGHSGAATSPGEPATAGLIIGAPEHDFSGDTTHYYYNNNVWSLFGMEVLGSFLTATGGVDIGKNVSLGKALLADAVKYRVDLARSIKVVTVAMVDGGQFLPVFAMLNATPPVNMHATKDSSYSNFRFYSEPMLTGTAILPREVMAFWLDLHNNKGGRLGGQSRFESHLDDMPTAGWGFGALVNNQTQDFQELLYGHAANYQSRGTFHSTEQLPFKGSGRYRDIPMTDPAPGGVAEDDDSAAALHSGLGYNGAETEISFCIVSNIIVARMTRWQLVMEDAGAIWLGRGAPQRWFTPGVGGFNVTAALAMGLRVI